MHLHRSCIYAANIELIQNANTMEGFLTANSHSERTLFILRTPVSHFGLQTNSSKKDSHSLQTVTVEGILLWDQCTLSISTAIFNITYAYTQYIENVPEIRRYNLHELLILNKETYIDILRRLMIYFLTAIGFSPGGSITVHIYTQTIHRTQTTANLEEWGPCPVFANFTLAFALQLRKKHGKISVRVRKPQSGYSQG